MLWIYGWHLAQFFTGLSGTATDLQYAIGVTAATCFFLPGVVCVADLAHRYVDTKAVILSKWVEEKVLDRDMK
jgi:hypothetical protein